MNSPTMGTQASLLAGVPSKLLKRLPAFLLNPDPNIYMSNDFVVFDFETNMKGDMYSPMPCWKDNKVVCGSWTYGLSGISHNIYGNEMEQGPLIDALEKAKFIVGQNGKFDMGWGKRAGIDLRKLLLYDTMIAEYVFNGNIRGELNLNFLAKKYVGYGKEPLVAILMKNKVDPEDMPRSMLVDRCNLDIIQTRDIFLKQRKLLQHNHMLGLVYTRCLLSPVLADMESMGMNLDPVVVKATYQERAEKLACAVAELDLFTGGINPRSVPQVRKFVYEDLKFTPKMVRKKPVFATGNEDLLALKATNKRQRKFIELKTTWSGYNADVTKNLMFFNGICTDLKPTGTVFYAQFNQCITKTHRLSSSGIKRTFPHVLNDNGKAVTKSVQFQNFKREFKCLMCAREEDWLMGEADGSQLEFRSAAFQCQCPVTTQAIVSNLDVHTDTARQLANNGEGKPWDERTDEERKGSRQGAKSRTFKPLYGGQSGTEPEKAYFTWFKEHYYGIAQQQQKWLDEALTNKKIVLKHGFIFYFPYCKMSRSGYISDTTNICNYPIQHFATAEIIPIAAVYLWHLMRDMRAFLVNTVHDSVIAELPRDEVLEFAELSKLAFTKFVYFYLDAVYNVQFNVPLGIGVKIGSHWGKGTEVKIAPMPPFKMEGIDYTDLTTSWLTEVDGVDVPCKLENIKW